MLENTQFEENQDKKMPSLNHSFICAELMRQFLQDETLQPLPELTLDIENGLTPDICVYKKENVHPNFFEDTLKMKELPLLAVEVISSSQNIASMLDKASLLLKAGIENIWTVEPYSHSVFVVNKTGKQLFHEAIVESDGIKMDFNKVFSSLR